jgi:hypothetical protein
LKQLAVDLEQALTETYASRHLVVDYNSRAAICKGELGIRMDTQVVGITHQEQRRDVMEHVSQTRQTAAHTDGKFDATVAGMAQSDQVLELVRLFERRERSERDSVVDVMLAFSLESAANLTSEKVSPASKVALRMPVRSIINIIIVPQAQVSKVSDRLLGQSNPITSGHHLGWWQVKLLGTDMLMAAPLDFPEAGHLAGDLDLSMGNG